VPATRRHPRLGSPSVPAPETILNAVTGERITFVRTAESTGGSALEQAYEVPSGSRLVALPHRHPDNDAFFEIVEGTGHYRVGRSWHEGSAPHRFTVPRDASHVHPINIGTGPLRLRQWVELDVPDPELVGGIPRYFETVAALSTEGKVNRLGLIKNPLQFALTVWELLMPGTYLAFPRPWAQGPPVRALAALARRLGLEAYHQAPPAPSVS
jgi:Cupin domain